MGLLLPLTALAALQGCEKEIAISYHSADPQLVIEGGVSPDGATVRLTTTKDMTDSGSQQGVTDARVTVTVDDTISRQLPHASRGYYRSVLLRGEPGRRYRLDVEAGGRHYSSTSTMMSPPVISGFRFVWQRMAGSKVLLADLRLQDIAGESNCYFVHIFRNGTGYRWAVARDNYNPNGELQMVFTCMTDTGNDDENDRINEGDRMEVQVRSIDRRAYDYLFSVQEMEHSGSNPIANFSGGCLGYFSAYCQTDTTVVYRAAEVVK